MEKLQTFTDVIILHLPEKRYQGLTYAYRKTLQRVAKSILLLIAMLVVVHALLV